MQPRHVLLILGSPGTGKTYLCASLAQWYFTKFKSFEYYTERNLISLLKQTFNESDWTEELKYLIDRELIILDDVGSGINPKQDKHNNYEWRIEVLFNFLDMRYNERSPTIITSNFSRRDFENIYSDRIVSRLFATENTIIEIFGEGLDKRTYGL